MIFTIYLYIVLISICAGDGGNQLPGPLPVALSGNLLQFGIRTHLTLVDWARDYGPIYGIKLGLKDSVVITDHKFIKELFDNSVSTGRFEPKPAMLEFTKGPYGGQTGAMWEAQRKTLVQLIRNFAYPKASRETIISDEVKFMLASLRSKEGSPVNGKRLFNGPLINSLWRTVTGDRYNWEEHPQFHETWLNLYRAILFIQMVGETTGFFYSPLIKVTAPGLFGWDGLKTSLNTIMTQFLESASKNETNFSYMTELQDLNDVKLVERGNLTILTEQNFKFHNDIGDADITSGLFSLFFAGTEPPILTMTWALLYLSENEAIQKKFQSEIDKVVGSSRLPTLSDRINMPYTEAVLSEVFRMRPAVPYGVPHEMKSNLNFHGYLIPKGASIISNIYGVHHDPEIWGDPAKFRPERFLNEDGCKFVPHEAIIPYGEGIRNCYGAAFGHDAVFLLLTGLFQQFSIQPEAGVYGKANLEPKIWYPGLLRPTPFKVVLSSRKCI